jgi:cation:H+ antiporter
LIASLLALIASGKYCIDEIILLARELDIAETLLGYFLLAIGTSLPELVTTWVAVKKQDGEMGMGNILGSNLFNLLFILGVSSFIQPVTVVGFVPDLLFLTGSILAVYMFAIFGKKYSFSKKKIGVVVFMDVSDIQIVKVVDKKTFSENPRPLLTTSSAIGID